MKEKLNYPTFDARDIEVSKAPFTSRGKAVAVIANRYDGIDFPGDECRVLVVAGLPRATNLQEKFLISRLGAVAMLNDRILTRVVQAFGRCTRSPTDFAAVIVEGEELSAFLLAIDRRCFLHPELQAELQFGIEQSKGQAEAAFLENLSEFLAQSSIWQDADSQIVQLREGVTRQVLPGTPDLARAVKSEIEYSIAMWLGDYTTAFEACRTIISVLNDPVLRGYRALWSYLAGSAAWLNFKNGVAGFDHQARVQYAGAQKAAPAVSWLLNLTRIEKAGKEVPGRDEALALQVENLEKCLESLGTVHDRKFDEEEKFISENVMRDESDKFEPAHERLGTLLGFSSGKVESTGSPDPWWMIHEGMCLVFEDHSDGKDSGVIHVTKARQVASHPKWIKENVPAAKEATIIPVLITPATHADKDAMPHLKDVCVWPLEQFRNWAKNALQVIRDIRRHFPASGDLAWRGTAADKLKAAQLDAHTIAGMVVSNSAEKILKIK